MILRIILGIVIGGIVGGVIGKINKCSAGGGWTMVKNPWSGIIFGAIFGLLIAMTLLH